MVVQVGNHCPTAILPLQLSPPLLYSFICKISRKISGFNLIRIHMRPSIIILKVIYTGAPVVGTPILGTHYIVSCDAEVCGAERESSRTIQGRMH